MQMQPLFLFPSFKKFKFFLPLSVLSSWLFMERFYTYTVLYVR